jgi:biopolymer transport protein ExbB/biopolymer transport protein TolQ
MHQLTLSAIWAHMGSFARIVVYFLGLMSLSSLVVMAERAITFLRSSADSRRYAAALAAAVEARGARAADDEALAQPEAPGHLGRVLAAGLRAWSTARVVGASPDLVFESVARAVERQAEREQQSLKRGLGLLATVGSTAPFVGLLGTVVGIIDAFEQIAATGSGGLATVSGGISEALVTTAAGLLVAIPAVMAYNGMLGWVDGRAVDMSEASNELLDHLALTLDAGMTLRERASGRMAAER